MKNLSINSLCVLSLILICCSPSTGEEITLQSLEPQQVFDTICTDRPGLEEVEAALNRQGYAAALQELLSYYRLKYPLESTKQQTNHQAADRIVNHTFQWGPYEPVDYGEEINWEWDPRGDIEWVASVYRFYWATPLANAYAATKNEEYAQAFVELTTDWIQKHPLEKHKRIHPVYTHWRGFAWLDIQTGIRATNLCRVFKTFVHAKSFTPEFLGILLASLYDHQVKTEQLPMGRVHNKAVFEQRGFINIAYTFQEFEDSKRWMEHALPIVTKSLLDQTTTDGVQREWSGGYHLGVLRDAVEIMQRMETIGIQVPANYKARVRMMYDYIYSIATPDLGFAMFGDTSRSIVKATDRSRWPLYGTLIEATDLLGDPKYAARAKLILDELPEQKSYAFSKAGMYMFRDKWGPDQIYMALHSSPPAISSHDQHDNGTFELYAYGRWLMPDTGYYTYGNDAKARKWHRQTRVHQTLTLDGQETKVDARELLWHTSSELDALVVQNKSYEDLVHRRAVWFVDKKFFVILDEAIGNAKGQLDLHFQFAPGEVRFNKEEHWVSTDFDDANILVWEDPSASVTVEEEEGWHAWKYGSRKPRKAFRYRHKDSSPAKFITLLAPYRGKGQPIINVSLNAPYEVGSNSIRMEVEAFEDTWEIGYDIDKKTAWSKHK